jgi:hypothetical protein
MTVATGNAILLGLARELEFGIPDAAAALEYMKPVLPANLGFVRSRAPGGEVNQSGFLEPGVPGPVTGPVDFAALLRAGALLMPLEHVIRGAAKATLEAGVYKYTFTPDLEGVDTSFAGIFAKPPIDQHQLFGTKLNGLAMQIGNNNAIPARFSGFTAHGTRLGAAEADAGNTGTYTVAPIVRGLLASDTGGDIHVSITRVTTSLQFKVERTAGVPTFPGAAVDVAYDPSTGRAVYQNLQDEAGLDLGIWAENYDPLEIVFPGTATNHADYAVGDTWVIPVSWVLPDATYLGGQRFTSAHQKNRFRAIGATTWDEFRSLTSQVGIQWPLTADQGSGSKYYYGLDRDGVFSATQQVVRKLTDRLFTDFLERHEPFEMETEWAGQQLANGPHRESVKLIWSNVQVATRAAPAANDRAIQETIQLVGETNDAGDPPLVVEVITDRDFTLAT